MRILCLLGILLAGCTTPPPLPRGGDEWDGKVFVKTYEKPEGVWAEVVSKDATPRVMHWRQKNGDYLVLHESGKLTRQSQGELTHILAEERRERGH